jgi:hypothetical protein
MEDLFAEQAADLAILTDDLFYQWEAGLSGYQPGLESGQASERKTVIIGGFDFNLFFVRSRCLRYDQTLLCRLGIKNPNSIKYYEYCSPDSPYVRYLDEKTWQRLPPKIRQQTKIAPFFHYFEANPRAKSLTIYLHRKDGSSQRFNITPNLAPVASNHFLVWPDPEEGFTGLRQSYHEDMLYWLDNLQLDAGYSLFFSAEGSGNSVATFHFQVLQAPFPVFGYLDRHYENRKGLIMTNMRAWPLPGILARYDSGTKDAVLAEFHRHISGWLSLDGSHTFNLLFRRRTGIREAFFIFREKGFTYISGIQNEFGACAAGGNIIVEACQDFDKFPGETDRLELANGAGQPMCLKDRQEVCYGKSYI